MQPIHVYNNRLHVNMYGWTRKRSLFLSVSSATMHLCILYKIQIIYIHVSHKKTHLLFIFINNILLNFNLLQNKLNNDQSVHSPTFLFEIRLSQGLIIIIIMRAA